MNTSFPDFAHKAFHTPRKKGDIIRAGREAIATKGILLTCKLFHRFVLVPKLCVRFVVTPDAFLL